MKLKNERVRDSSSLSFFLESRASSFIHKLKSETERNTERQTERQGGKEQANVWTGADMSINQWKREKECMKMRGNTKNLRAKSLCHASWKNRETTREENSRCISCIPYTVLHWIIIIDRERYLYNNESNLCRGLFVFVTYSVFVCCLRIRGWSVLEMREQMRREKRKEALSWVDNKEQWCSDVFDEISCLQD